MAFEAKIIKDSINNGSRLTTMQLTHPRIIHAEFNTHCMFARNASSSRAIPFSKTVQRVMDDPFIPVRFGKNQKGMQAFEYLEGVELEKAIKIWLEARDKAVEFATRLSESTCSNCRGKGYTEDHDYQAGTSQYDCDECNNTGGGLNVHKQIVNRLIEPWSWITVCVTGDSSAWSNYFALRCHPDAADDIQKQAYMAQKAYFESTPEELAPGQWHLPYVSNEEVASLLYLAGDIEKAVKVSVGRCARTSYLTQEGVRDFNEDIRLHDRLTTHTPLHASPMEHVCMASAMHDHRYHKYVGWRSYRHMLPNEYVTDFKPNYQEPNHI